MYECNKQTREKAGSIITKTPTSLTCYWEFFYCVFWCFRYYQMDPILLQKQVRDNSEDLRTYLKELQGWEDEMKRKESTSNEKTSQASFKVRDKSLL